MKRRTIIIAISAAIAFFAIPFIIFHARSPVLLVADASLIQLYGEARTRRENFRSSLSLFRPVKTVAIADDSGDDLVQIAVEEISSHPFCVVFPFRFADAARLYREQNPQILVILLEGRSENTKPADFPEIFIYKTDIEADFYTAAAAIAAIERGENVKIAVFVETQLQTKCREAFSNAFSGMEMPPEALFYTAFSQYSENTDFSCVILAGTGVEYLESHSGLPVIFFTWIDPLMMPEDVVLIVDDSPWAQLSQAVKMAAAGLQEGLIKSDFKVINRKKVSVSVLRKIKKMG